MVRMGQIHEFWRRYWAHFGHIQRASAVRFPWFFWHQLCVSVDFGCFHFDIAGACDSDLEIGLLKREILNKKATLQNMVSNFRKKPTFCLQPPSFCADFIQLPEPMDMIDWSLRSLVWRNWKLNFFNFAKMINLFANQNNTSWQCCHKTRVSVRRILLTLPFNDEAEIAEPLTVMKKTEELCVGHSGELFSWFTFRRNEEFTNFTIAASSCAPREMSLQTIFSAPRGFFTRVGIEDSGCEIKSTEELRPK